MVNLKRLICKRIDLKSNFFTYILLITLVYLIFKDLENEPLNQFDRLNHNDEFETRQQIAEDNKISDINHNEVGKISLLII